MVLEWIIAPDGAVIRPKAVKSSSVDFELPAIEALKASLWSPGKLNGKAVAVRVRQKVEFTLD